MEENRHLQIRAQSIVRAGQRHRQENAACEAVSLCIETQSICFYALADGQSGKRHCREGAQAVLRALAEYLERRTVPALLRSYDDEVQYALTRVIRRTIKRLSKEYREDEAEFSSTVVALVIDPQTGAYLSIHLGDGAMLGIRRNMKPVLLSPPENALTGRCTWLTASPDLLRHVRLRKGTTDAVDRMVLATDGASMLCRGSWIAKRAEALLCDLERPERIVQAVACASGWDDAGCVVVDFG